MQLCRQPGRAVEVNVAICYRVLSPPIQVPGATQSRLCLCVHQCSQYSCFVPRLPVHCHVSRRPDTLEKVIQDTRRMHGKSSSRVRTTSTDQVDDRPVGPCHIHHPFSRLIGLHRGSTWERHLAMQVCNCGDGSTGTRCHQNGTHSISTQTPWYCRGAAYSHQGRR